jgi:hypothetical protein
MRSDIRASPNALVAVAGRECERDPDTRNRAAKLRLFSLPQEGIIYFCDATYLGGGAAPGVAPSNFSPAPTTKLIKLIDPRFSSARVQGSRLPLVQHARVGTNGEVRWDPRASDRKSGPRRRRVRVR